MRPVYREEPCRTALNKVTGMSFRWSLNPYTGCAHRCTFCFVRAFELRADRPSDDRYGRSIRVKTNIAEVLRRELARRSWKREHVVVGTATDPYQPAEGHYRLTRTCLEAFAQARNPTSMITRGPMIVRDIDVLQQLSAVAEFSVTVSIPTVDRDVWLRTEPGTAPPRQRLAMVKRLNASGIRAGIGMAPILPGLSDRPEQLAQVVRAARDADAAFVWTNVLYLRPGTREHFLENLARDWPELLPEYERLYNGRAYVSKSVLEPVRREVARLKALYGVGERPERGAPPRVPPGADVTPGTVPEIEGQLPLAM